MGAAQKIGIGGSKGTDTAHTPVESPDSLIDTSYANILDAISEGPIVGLVKGAQSIFYNQTPLANADGSLNFTGVTWDQRTGEAEQNYITGFPAVESETNVGVELKFSKSWTQAISNLQLSAVRVRIGVSTLYQTETDGDTVGYLINYAIDVSTDGADYVTVLSPAFNGKTTTGYQRSHRIDLPKAVSGWQIRIRRLTADSTVSAIQANTSIVSYTEVIDAKLQYPFTALVGTKIDASQFSSIPERAFRIKGRIVQVPSNYDPATRIYSGAWDGTFKLAWTDCPPWVYRDLILNDRYGLGSVITDDQVDKWGLYQVAGYCDEMVSDGKGGLEPRFTTNLYLQTRADALTVLQDMASVFRGMSYYAASEVMVSADMPSDPVYTYTNGNVIGGKFSRAGSSGSTRYSVCKVSWSDRENFGATKVEYVQDQRSIARYGIRETEVTAFACVSQGQAQRMGHYILLTNQLETDTISFSVGLDGTLARPGQLIRVSDENYVGKPMAGRIKASTAQTVTLDNDVVASAGDTLVIILPTGTAETRVIQGFAGRVVTVTESFSSAPVAQSIYTIETAEVVSEVYRILSVVENFGDDKLQYDVVAVQHNASKFAAIDNGAQIVTMPTTILPSSIQAIPTGVALTTYDSVKQGLAVATMRITWNPSVGAASYNIWWRRGSSDWVYSGVTYTASMEVPGIYTGTYTARIAAIGVNGNSSLWAYSDPTDLLGKTGSPPAVTSLTAKSLLFGIGLGWTFPAGAEDTQRTEIWYGPTPVIAAATKLSDLSYPQADYVMQNLQAGAAFFFWARLVDRSGNIGPFFPVGNGVQGIASTDAGLILDQIAGQIGETELGQSLTSRIDLIDGPSTVAGSVNARLADAQAAVDQQISDVNDQITETRNDLQAQIDDIGDIASSGAYDATKTYAVGDSVRQGQRLYQATQAVPISTTPPNATYWLDVGQVVSDSNGLAARVTANEAHLGTIDGTLTSQASTISGVQSSLTVTNGNVTAAQNAANAANTLAGGKGKVLVQTTTPVAADQLAQNLWIDITGGNNTPKRWNGSAWAAVTDKVATDAAAAAANALTVANTKADASALNSLTTRVTSAEGTISSQGTSITGLTNSLTTTNTNVTAAQAAATAANTLAGSKGKVMVQTATPAVADQLVQNLWIDITSSANTPKRWNGSAWAAVTDKVATDAATAAANALSVANTKADASAVTALTSRVTSAEGTISSQGSNITSLTNSLATTNTNVTAAQNAATTAQTAAQAASDLAGGKGKVLFQSTTPVAADQLTQNLWIDTTSSANTPKRWNGTAWAIVTDKVASDAAAAAANALSVANTKADSSAVTSLTSRVTSAEGTISSQGTSITNLTGSLTTTNGNVTTAQNAATAAAALAGSKGKTMVQTATPAVADQLAQNLWIDITNGANTPKRWDGSAWSAVSDKIATDAATAAANALALANTKADGSAVTALTNRVTSAEGAISSQATSITNLNSSLTTTNGNVTAAQTAATNAAALAGSKGKVMVQTATPAAADQLAQNLWIDITSGANTPKRWDGSAWSAVSDKIATDAATAAASALSVANANASAVTALTSRVTTAEGAISSQGSAITTLTGRVTNTETGITGATNAISALDTRVTSVDGAVQAQAAATQSLNASVRGGDDEGDLAAAMQAWTSTASIAQESTARATSDSAAATATTTLQASIAQTNATVQIVSAAQTASDGRASASWQVKLQVNSLGQYVAAGIGLGIENTAAGLQSQFLVSADRFAVINGIDGTLTSPFAVQGGQVFINSAVIQDLSLSFGKISDNLQSNDYVANSTGWKLSKAGGIELNSTVSGQGRVQVTNRAVKVWDASGVLRVQLGDLSA